MCISEEQFKSQLDPESREIWESFNKMKLQYFKVGGRNNKRRKGILLAAPKPGSPNKVVLGYSLCNSKLDRFDPDFGIDLAFSRALAWDEKETTRKKRPTVLARKVPDSIRQDLTLFIWRMKRWFKDKELPEWTEAFIQEENLNFICKMATLPTLPENEYCA